MLTNSISLKRVSHLFAVVAVTATIAACGGGGGAAPAPAPAPASALSSLQGTWLGLCEVKRSGNGSAVGSEKDTVVIAAGANSSVAATSTERFYSSNDCSGTAVATVINPAISLSANGTKTVGPASVIKVDVSISGGVPSFSGSNASLVAATSPICGNQAAVVVTLGGGVNQIAICNTSNTAGTVKQIIALSASDTQLDFGDEEGGLDAEGFPNTLSPPSDRYTKQ